MRTITLASAGASGMPYRSRLLECVRAAGARVRLPCDPISASGAPS
jgi:3-polyprenyl-4-hydroxybenzoate decarboxylase